MKDAKPYVIEPSSSVSTVSKQSKWPMIINAVLFQALWFSVMVFEQFGLALFLSALVVQFFYQRHATRSAISLSLPFKVLVFGVFMDMGLTFLGLYHFPENQLHPNIFDVRFFVIPLWLIGLWLGFVLTLQHSLQWLRVRKTVCVIAFSVFGTMSYLAGRRFEMIQFNNESILFLLLGWAAVGWVASSQDSYRGVNYTNKGVI